MKNIIQLSFLRLEFFEKIFFYLFETTFSEVISRKEHYTFGTNVASNNIE